MTKSFRLKKAVNVASAVGLIGSVGVAGNALVDVTFYTADGTNTSIQTVGLNKSYLGYDTLAQAGGLATLDTGTFNYKYAAVTFTATEDGTYKFGQTTSPVDSIMILYNGVFDPLHPGANALVGNDDTGEAIHRASLGSAYPTSDPILCWITSYCPVLGHQLLPASGASSYRWFDVYPVFLGI